MKVKNGTLNVSRERVGDLFVGAVEGGSTYWARDLELPRGRGWYYNRMLNHGFAVTDAEGTRHEVTPEKIERALNRMASEHPRHFADFREGQDDATTADVFFQLCVLGEVVYG
jgi:hypothetical protein